MNFPKSGRYASGINNILRMLRPACAISLALAVTASCIFDDVSGCPPLPDDGGYTINIALSAGSFATRTSGHNYNPGTDDESFINIPSEDYAVFIFDGEGNFVQRFEPGAVSLQRNGTDKYRYVLSGAFRPEKELSSIQLMVLANWNTSFGGSYINFEKEIGGYGTETESTLNQIYAETGKFNFKMPADRSGATPVSWMPSEGNSGIPMFGLSKTVSLSDEEELIELSGDYEIPVLRSLAKIEILDKVPTGPANIERCVLTSWNTSGRFVPDGRDVEKGNPEWNSPGTQVEYPSLPAGVVSETNLQFAKTKKTVEIDGEDTEKDCFVVYVPEMNLAVDTPPVLEVYVKGMTDPYKVVLSEYEEGKPKEGTEYEALLRNHIYRYNILSVGVTANLELYIETPEWELDEDEYVYNDAAAQWYVADGETKSFSWVMTDEEREKGLKIPAANHDSDEVILAGEEGNRRNVVVSIAGGTEAVATFTIAEPVRGLWTLALYADDGTPNHWFRIDLWDAEHGTWIEGNDTLSGEVAKAGETPQEVKIRIVAKELQFTESPNTARLVMNATTFDGRMVELNLTSDDPMKPVGTSDHYIIKQYPTATM